MTSCWRASHMKVWYKWCEHASNITLAVLNTEGYIHTTMSNMQWRTDGQTGWHSQCKCHDGDGRSSTAMGNCKHRQLETTNQWEPTHAGKTKDNVTLKQCNALIPQDCGVVYTLSEVLCEVEGWLRGWRCVHKWAISFKSSVWVSMRHNLVPSETLHLT